MRIVLQRVNKARVSVENIVTGEISRGLVLLAGFGREDPTPPLKAMAQKIANLRVFAQGDSSFDLSLLQTGGQLLLVPQFTLYADARKGRRPDFFSAMEPERASLLFEQFVEEFRALGVNKVATGRFGAHMRLELENDGPVTLFLDSGV